MKRKALRDKTLADLGDQQRVAMEAIWESGGATVRQVAERMGGRRRLAYTTVLSTLQKLEVNGWLRHERVGRHHVYRPILSRQEAAARAVDDFVHRVFDGDPRPLLRLLGVTRRKPSLRDLVDARRSAA